MAIRRTSAATTINRGVSAAAATPVNIITGSGGTGATVNISSIQIANSGFTALDDTAVSTAGGFIIINGTGFQSGASVRIQGTSATSVAFVSSSRLNVTVPAISSGTLDIYVINPDGSGAILISGFVSSGVPSWTTTSPLTGQDVDTAFSIQLAATGDGTVTYGVSSGSTLPSGTTLASNGRFSGTVTGIEQDTTYTFSVDAIDSQNQETVRSFNITVTAYDQYYYLTTLHLSGETPANTWISDASANSFNITVVGDTRPMAFSPYETVWSNYFDGTGDYLTVPTNAALDFGTGDFTVEFWWYPTTVATDQGFLGGGGGCYDFVWRTSTGFNLGRINVAFDNTFAFTAVANIWYHVAYSRSGTSLRVFVNGTQVGSTATNSISYGTNGTTAVIGGSTTGDRLLTGYISNLRLVKGSAVYTANFTPPTTQLTAISNTSLLTCQSNRLIDNSTNNFTLTKNGDVTVSNFGTFTETDLTTGSGYFDGTGDYLTAPSNSAFNFGTGDFTIECWIYPITLSNAPAVIAKATSVGGLVGWFLEVGTNAVYFGAGTNSGQFGTFSVTLPINAWSHIACTRSAGVLNCFVNGVSPGSQSSGLTGSYDNSNVLQIGRGFGNAGYDFSGYISNVRIVKGTVAYTGNFTPPVNTLVLTGSSPYSNTTNVNTTFSSANTSLLTLQNRFGENNNRFVDTSGINNIVTRNGNATQGTFSPFSQNGWSNYFDGSSTLYFAGAPISTTQTNFTIEAWVYLTADPTFGGGVGQVVVDGGGLSGGSYWGFGLNTSRNIVFRWYDGASGFNCTSTSAVSLNQWAHIAVSVSSNAIKLFINGNLQSTTGTSTLTNRGGNQGNINVGRYATTDALFGYISNARIVTGAGLYSASFTPSTTPLTTTVSSGTVAFLTAKSNRFEDNSTGNRTPVLAGSPSVQAFSPFKPTSEWSLSTVGGSMYFDGTGDYLSIASNSLNNLSGDFTVEAWIYRTVSGVLHPIFDLGDYAGASGILFYVTSGNALAVFTNNGLAMSGGTVSPAAWTHVALVRSGTGSGNMKLYLNGVSVGTPATNTTTFSGTLLVGADLYNTAITNFMNGYISDVRVLKVAALYTVNFTPPTAPAAPIANTTLLLSGTNGGIVDYTSKNNLQTVGNTQLSTTQTKFGNASMSFDGSGDWLDAPNVLNAQFGTGDFTMEGWLYLNSLAAPHVLFEFRAGLTASYGQVYITTGGVLRFYLPTDVGTSNTFSTGTWTHFAITRASGILRMFIGGVQGYSETYTTAMDAARFRIGAGADGAAGLNGYIDDLRFTKGFARYTSNFTVPDQAFKLR